MAVRFSEKWGSARWTRTRSGWSGSRVFHVPNTIEGLSRLPQIGSAWRVMPNVDLVCLRHEYEHLGRYVGGTPEGYVVTVEYQSVPLATDPIITFSVEGEALSTGKLRKYVSDEAYRLEPTAELYPTIGMNIEIQLQEADLTTYFGLIGKINNSPVQILGRYTWGAKKLLFVGIDTRVEYNEAGIRVYHCHFRFSYRPNIPSWNHVWRAEGGVWRVEGGVWRVEGGEMQGKWDKLTPPLYVEADFNPLQWLLNG